MGCKNRAWGDRGVRDPLPHSPTIYLLLRREEHCALSKSGTGSPVHGGKRGHEETQGRFFSVRGVNNGEVIAKNEVCAKENDLYGKAQTRCRIFVDQRLEESCTHGFL